MMMPETIQIPPVTEIFAGATTAAEAVDVLVRDGGIIIRNFVPGSTISRLNDELRPYVVADEESYAGSFFPPETRKVLGLAAKSRTWALEILSHPLWTGITDALLTTRTSAWIGDDLHESTSKPQLSSSGLLCIGPGAKAQPLHRDDMIHHAAHPRIAPDQYEIGRDSSVGIFVAGTRCTRDNGATRFQPRSHLQATLQRPDEDCVVFAEMEAGDAFVMLASCYHGGSANSTQDEVRWVYSSFITKGYLRQVGSKIPCAFSSWRPLECVRIIEVLVTILHYIESTT